MKKNWYKKLPEGFTQVYCIDAKDKKVSRKMNLLAMALALVVLVPFTLVFYKNSGSSASYDKKTVLIYLAGFFIAYFLYVFLHELTHGLAYKLTTHHKLTYGMTLSVAFCGVPDIYVRRNIMFVSILAPFVVFSLIFGTALIVLEHTLLWYDVAILFASNIGGCIGDLWGSVYMATHY